MLAFLRRSIAAVLCTTLLPFSAVAAPVADEHVFHPGDEIEVQVLTTPDSMSGYVARVVLPEEGVVSLPHVGRVAVTGKTASQILPDLNRQYRKLFAYAYVGMQLLKAKPLEPLPTEAVYVAGQVRNPGAYTPSQVGKRMTLADLIGRSGGPTEVADLDHVTIFRRQGTAEVVNLDLAMRDGSAARIELAPGETVRVPGNWLAGLSTYGPVIQAVTGVVGIVAVVFGVWNTTRIAPAGTASP